MALKDKIRALADVPTRTVFLLGVLLGCLITAAVDNMTPLVRSYTDFIFVTVIIYLWLSLWYRIFDTYLLKALSVIKTDWIYFTIYVLAIAGIVAITSTGCAVFFYLWIDNLGEILNSWKL